MLAPAKNPATVDGTLRSLIHSFRASQVELNEISAAHTRRREFLVQELHAIRARGSQLGMTADFIGLLIRRPEEDAFQEPLPFGLPLPSRAPHTQESERGPAYFARSFPPVNDSEEMLAALRGYLRARAESPKGRTSF